MSDEPNLSPGGVPPGLEPGKPDKPIRGQAELREFLLRAAELLRLEPKKPVAAELLDGEQKPTAGKSFLSRIPPGARIGALALVVLLIVALTVSSGGSTVLPEPVHGVWRTDAPGYATRRFEVTEKNLAFQTDENPSAITRHVITRVNKSTVKEGTLYQVDYLDQPEDKSPLTFEFILTEGDNPTIVFANQRKVVWKRSGPVKGDG